MKPTKCSAKEKKRGKKSEESEKKKSSLLCYFFYCYLQEVHELDPKILKITVGTIPSEKNSSLSNSWEVHIHRVGKYVIAFLRW